MISARIDTPAVAPAPPQRPVQAACGRDGRPAPAFDDALRDQEAASATPDADAPTKDADAAPTPVSDFPQAPVAPPPVALDQLLAQVLPQPPAPVKAEAPTLPETASPVAQQVVPQAVAQRGDARRMPGAVAAERQALKAATADAIETAPVDDMDASAIEAPAEAPAPKPQHGRSAEAPGHTFTPANEGQGARAERDGKENRNDIADAPVRSVAVSKVSTTTHFPVTTDPIRQIATEVTRALETKSVASAPEPQNAPVKTISVQLEPESLGTVTLRMRLSGDQLSVRVDVAEPATLDMIQRERDRLQKSMATDNVSIDRLEIRAASEPTPVTSGDNANGPRQDANAPGQQSRHNASSQSGEHRRDGRGEQPARAPQRNGQDNDSARSSDSRGVYL